MSITIRPYQPADEKAIERITYLTGFKGEDLTGRGYFNDQRLWFMIFIYYYCRYEPEHFFVVADEASSEVVGFICGTPDTDAQEKRFKKKVVPRILLRGIFVTLLLYPRSFMRLLDMAKMWQEDYSEQAAEIVRAYPAHLHINLLEGYQGKGIGGQLMRTFEAHMRELGAAGIHLSTTSYNRKAVPYYEHMGFAVLVETEAHNSELEGLRYLTMGKVL